MAELTGKQAVEDYIRQCDKTYGEVYRQNENGQMARPVWSFSAQDANKLAEVFGQWADVFNNSGQNWTPYRITLSDGINPNEPGTGAASRKRWSSMSATFVLNNQNILPGMGAPAKRTEDGQVIYYVPQGQQQTTPQQGIDYTKYILKDEMQAAINHAVLNAQLNERLTRLEAENLEQARIIRELEYELYGDEDEEEEEELNGEEELTKVWTPESIKSMIGTAKSAVMDIVSNVKDSKGPVKLNAVAGEPAETSKVTIPAGAAPGTFPAYVEPTPENAAQIQEDQFIKINKAIPKLYQLDMHIGDDLIRLLYMAMNKQKTFNNAIDTLREEIVPQTFIDEIMI